MFVLGASVVSIAVMVAIPLLLLWLAAAFVGARYIPNESVGIVEKLWSLRGSVGEGRIIAPGGEAGYQSAGLRGGLHFRLGPWRYRSRKGPRSGPHPTPTEAP